MMKRISPLASFSAKAGRLDLVAEEGADVTQPPAAERPAPIATVAPTPPAPVAAPSAADERPRRRTSRVKTTLLGFDRSDGRSEDIFSARPEEKVARSTSFPTGWLVVTTGPGRGSFFTLQAGVSQIGRGDDQAVQLDFGDAGISRSNHAAIAYDDETRKFYLGHGGKTNIVRLNGMPVLSTESLNDGDLIRIGETTLTFVSFCSEEFSWTGT